MVAGYSVSELRLLFFLLSSKLKEMKSMLVVEAINLGLKCLKVALMLLKFATGAILFSRASDF